MDTVNFKARFVDNAFIQVKRGNNTPLYKEVSILKISKNSKSDKEALLKTCEEWAKKNKLAKILMHTLNGTFQSDDRDIYILSQQENGFRKLIPEQILGMAEVTNHDEFCRIDYLQTNPKYESKNKNRKISNSGRSIVDYILYKAGKRKTYVNSVDNAVGFYKSCGFKILLDGNFMPLMIYDPDDEQAG